MTEQSVAGGNAPVIGPAVVQLERVTSVVSRRYGMYSQYLSFEVSVANLAYVKRVYVHLRRADGQWVDVPLEFRRLQSGQREIWTGTFNPGSNHTLDAVFAVRYETAGQTWWDNNGGWNYCIAADSGNRLGPHVNVLLYDYLPCAILPEGGTHFWGTVTLRNRCLHKTVRVHYSTDDWQTHHIVNAQFNHAPWSGWYSEARNPNIFDAEEWVFNAEIDANATQIDFAVEYVAEGESFWDNNGGSNYRTMFIRQ